MSCPNPRDCAERSLASPAEADRKAERAVLAFLIDEHPNQLTIAEVSWALNAGPAEFADEDAVERAVRELVATGLLHCKCGFILPARAALYYHRLGRD